MEIFKVNRCTEDLIDLKSPAQMESLFEMIKDSAEVMIKWEDEDADGDDVKKSKILITDGLMSRIKDGRFEITSTEESNE